MLQPKTSLTVVCCTRCEVRPKHVIRTKAMTLVEVMLAVAVIIVAALGTLCYEYLCVDHIRFARAQLAATRVGQLLIEDWKSSGGSADYNPEDLKMGFDLPPGPPAGNYMTVIDDLPLYISMSHSDVATDPVAGVTLRKISVVVHWKKDFGSGAVDDDDPGVNLTTYVRRDQ
jgi:Tfp pilus assembly protein PilV